VRPLANGHHEGRVGGDLKLRGRMLPRDEGHAALLGRDGDLGDRIQVHSPQHRQMPVVRAITPQAEGIDRRRDVELQPSAGFRMPQLQTKYSAFALAEGNAEC